MYVCMFITKKKKNSLLWKTKEKTKKCKREKKSINQLDFSISQLFMRGTQCQHTLYIQLYTHTRL